MATITITHPTPATSKVEVKEANGEVDESAHEAGTTTKDDVTITIKETSPGGVQSTDDPPSNSSPAWITPAPVTAPITTPSQPAPPSRKTTATATGSKSHRSSQKKTTADSGNKMAEVPFVIPRLTPRDVTPAVHGGGHKHRALHAHMVIPQPKPLPQPAAEISTSITTAPYDPPTVVQSAPPPIQSQPTQAGTGQPAPALNQIQTQPVTTTVLSVPQPGHIPHRFPHSADTSETAAEASQPIYVQSIQPQRTLIASTVPVGQSTQAPAPPIAPIHYVQLSGVDTAPAIYSGDNPVGGQSSMLGLKGWQSSSETNLTAQPTTFSQIKPIPIIDYHALIHGSPVLASASLPLPEILNPTPGPSSVFQDSRVPATVTMPTTPATQPTRGQRPDYYHRHDQERHRTRRHQDDSHRHRSLPRYEDSESSSDEIEEHHHDDDEHHHHHHKPYRHVDDTASPADRVGLYAYPPDYSSRLDREAKDREAEVERERKRIVGGQWPGMPGTGGYLAMGPAMYGRPPGIMGMGGPLIPPFIGGHPPIRPMPMIGMGPGMGMGMGMGMPLNPIMGPGMLGFNPNAIPGRFGRDWLGRDFAGPGGVGRSRPYRPPDPSVLHPLPQGLPVQARPPMEGFDAFGRKIPPPPPEGFDGWGRWIDPSKPDPRISGMVPGIPGFGGQGMFGRPPFPGGPPGPGGVPGTLGWSAVQPTEPSKPITPAKAELDRPEPPPMFSRAPSTDARFSYGDFTPFSFDATSLAHPQYLQLPSEFKRRDIYASDWTYFIEALANEAFRFASSSRDSHSDSHRRDEPRLTFDVHQLLGAWNVGFFGPRSIKVFPAKNGKKLFGDLGNPTDRAALTIRNGDLGSSISSYSSDSDDVELRRSHQSARERRYLREQRRKRRRERKEAERYARGAVVVGDWEVRFEWTEPLKWIPGAKARKYGDKNVFERPKIPGPMGMMM